MAIKKVYAVYFSPTGTTKKTVELIAGEIAKKLERPLERVDFTLPETRRQPLHFAEDSLVIFGMPVIAGRLPNLMLGFLSEIKGNGALAVPVVLFGNRAYDDALIELRDLLRKSGLFPIAAAAFAGEHSFSYELGKGRPDAEDMQIARDFSGKIAKKLDEPGLQENLRDLSQVVQVKGNPDYHSYYKPLDQEGYPIDIRKVKPKTAARCNDCKICALACPMGSIDYENVSKVSGICIKCNACVKKCPLQAKYFDDEGYLFHKRDLEEKYKERAKVETFI